MRIQEGLGRTWKGPAPSVFSRIITRRTVTAEKTPVRTQTRRPGPAVAKTSPAVSRPAAPAAGIKFRPGADTGIGDLLAEAFSTNETQKQLLSDLFSQLKQAYETEVAKEGKSNDVAAAMTFFIASNVVAYHDAGMPSDDATEEFYNSIRDVMAATPEIARLTNAQKQQTHDWLVYMGGFVLAGYMNAKNTRDRKSLADYKSIADQSMRIVLGIGPADFTPNLSGKK